MASKDQYCSICELQHKTNTAEEWCPDCDEYLCSTCKTHHGLAKATKNHKTLALSDVKNLPAFVLDIKTYCDEHQEKFEYFCPKHDTPFCVHCNEIHKDCGKFTVIRDLQGTKTSANMTLLEENLADINQRLKKLSDDRHLNLANLKNQRLQCQQKVKEIRLNIDKHLDQLEDKIMKEINDVYVKHKTELEDFLNDVNTKKAKIEQIQDDVGKIKQHASEIQTFLSSRKLAKDLGEDEENIKLMYDEKKLENVELSILPEKNCVTGDILKSFGQVKLKKNPGNITWKDKATIKAQMVMPTALKDINEIKAIKRLHIDLKEKFRDVQIIGFTSTPDGRILLCDQKKSRIIIIAPDGNHIRDISVQHKPNNIVYVDGNVFVSSWPSKSLRCIDLETSRVTKEVTFEVHCDALGTDDDNIIIHLLNSEYKIFDQKLNEIRRIPISIPYAPFLSCLGNRLYFCQWEENVVYSYNMKGEQQWKFQHEDLSSVLGVTTDDNGNVYVSGYKSNNIMIISTKGNRSKVLFTENELMKNPYCIFLNKQTKRLLVTSANILTEFDMM